MTRTSRVTIATAVVAGFAAGSIFGGTVGDARAETATMVGSFGFAPNYSAMKLCPCAPIRHNTMPTQSGLTDVVRKIDAWMATPPAPTQTAVPGTPPQRTLVTYSMSTQGTTGWLREHADEPEARITKFVMVGSPETPGNGWQGDGYRHVEGLPTAQGPVLDNATFVVRQYDPVADKAQNPNFWSTINAKLSTHIKGYDNVDLDNPDATYTDPKTGSVTKYYRSDVLPMLAWRQKFTSPERMAQLDAKYRPRIEKAYDRPIDLEGQWSEKNEDATESSSVTGTGTSSRRVASRSHDPATTTRSFSPTQRQPYRFIQRWVEGYRHHRRFAEAYDRLGIRGMTW